MWKSQVIWFLWKTYWFVKQLKLSCRDIRPGNTCGEVIFCFGKSQKLGCMSELGILLGLSPASSMLRPVDVLSSSWQPSSATSGSRSWEQTGHPHCPALSCFLAGCNTATASKRPDPSQNRPKQRQEETDWCWGCPRNCWKSWEKCYSATRCRSRQWYVLLASRTEKKWCASVLLTEQELLWVKKLIAVLKRGQVRSVWNFKGLLERLKKFLTLWRNWDVISDSSLCSSLFPFFWHLSICSARLTSPRENKNPPTWEDFWIFCGNLSLPAGDLLCDLGWIV